jgi:hypothetical protein
MKAEKEKFQELRRLLTLKRHEQPPPGYFNDFSSQVIGRIRVGDRGVDAGSGWFFSEVPWLKCFWETLETKPVFAGGFAVAVCGLLVAGVIYSENPSSAEPGYITGFDPAGSAMVADASGSTYGTASPQESTVLPGAADSLSASALLNPQRSGSLFQEFQKAPQAQPPVLNVSFPASGN